METVKQSLQRMLNSGQGWDRQAEALIAKAFYGGCEGMVRHYIAILDNLEREQSRRDWIRDKAAAIEDERQKKAAA